MANNDFNENELKMFNPWRPANQLPYPAIAGQILLTKSDFTLPARPDLLEWKKVEEVIGVYDVSMEIAEDGLSATFYKIVNLEKLEIGTIGIVTRSEAEKLKAIKYVKYYLDANTETHILKLYGEDKDGNVEQIADDVSYASYLDIERLDAKIDTETERATTKENELNDKINTETERATTKENELDNKIVVETQRALNTESELDVKIQAEADTRAQAVLRLRQDLESLTARVVLLEDNQRDVILPIINIIRTATNPELVLVKDSDGVGIRWANRLGIDGVVIEENATTNTISFYEIKNEVKTQIGQIDKFNYEDFKTWQRVLQQIDDDLNESAESGFVLTKLQDGDRYDWQDLNDLINFEITQGKPLDTIKITINGDTERAFIFKVINEDELDEILRRLNFAEIDIQEIKNKIGDTDISDIGSTLTEAIRYIDDYIGNEDISEIGDTIAEAIHNLFIKQEELDQNKVGFWYGTQEEYEEEPSQVANNSLVILEEV